MEKIVYDKLVRDRIPEIIEKAGKEAVCHVADRREALDYLARKLEEEAREYAQSRETEELADVLEVILAIAAESGASMDAIEKLRAEKAKKRGGFSRRIILEEVRVP